MLPYAHQCLATIWEGQQIPHLFLSQGVGNVCGFFSWVVLEKQQFASMFTHFYELS